MQRLKSIVARPEAALLCALAGLLLGIWIQHRWPLGRLRERTAQQSRPPGPSTASIASLPASRRVVILAVGQSNAANYVETRSAGGRGVYVFSAGELWAAVDPLPGADGAGGSVWSRLGARLALTGAYDAVVIAVAAQGSTSVGDWVPGGACHQRLEGTLLSLAEAGLPPDFVLWHQGESEGRNPDASGAEYATALQAVLAACQRHAPHARFIIARSTRHGSDPKNEQIQLAQRAVAESKGAAPGPDLDELGAAFRCDGVHFNARGADAAAMLWLQSLQAASADPRIGRP